MPRQQGEGPLCKVHGALSEGLVSPENNGVFIKACVMWALVSVSSSVDKVPTRSVNLHTVDGAIISGVFARRRRG